jgi:hypothetical protein
VGADEDETDCIDWFKKETTINVNTNATSITLIFILAQIKIISLNITA